MRAYQLHDASWSRIVSERVQRPAAIAARLSSRRRPAHPVPADGQLVLLSCNHASDPRTGAVVDRRELLDRIIEALSVSAIDGVIASADLLEELTLLNVLERRLAFCYASTEAARPGRCGVTSSTIAESHFDGAHIARHWRAGAPGDSRPWCAAADMAELAARDLPTILDLFVTGDDDGSPFDTQWADWIAPIHETTSAIATGAGVWMTVPAISGLAHLAEIAAFPILLRDTDVPVAPAAWRHLFEAGLPITVRGMIAGASALFPIEGTVAEATRSIAAAVRGRAAA